MHKKLSLFAIIVVSSWQKLCIIELKTIYSNFLKKYIYTIYIIKQQTSATFVSEFCMAIMCMSLRLSSVFIDRFYFILYFSEHSRQQPFAWQKYLFNNNNHHQVVIWDHWYFIYCIVTSKICIVESEHSEREQEIVKKKYIYI